MKFRFCIVLFLCWIVSSCATWYQRTAAFQDAVSKGEFEQAENLLQKEMCIRDRVEAVMKSLEEKNKSIRFILGKKVGKQMRIVPELRCFVDDSLDDIDKIDEVLK